MTAAEVLKALARIEELLGKAIALDLPGEAQALGRSRHGPATRNVFELNVWTRSPIVRLTSQPGRGHIALDLKRAPRLASRGRGG